MLHNKHKDVLQKAVKKQIKRPNLAKYIDFYTNFAYSIIKSPLINTELMILVSGPNRTDETLDRMALIMISLKLC